MSADRIFLIGLSGSGKSTVARLVADALGWDAADTDRMIEATAGKTVSELFAAEGEARFRLREIAALEQVCRTERVVVATGGGAPTTAEGRLCIGRGFSTWLAVTPGIAAARLCDDEAGEARPLLLDDPQRRLEAQLVARRAVYQLADAVIDVDGMSPPRVAAEVVRLWRESRAMAAPVSRMATGDPREGELGTAAVVRTPAASSTYPVIVRKDALHDVGRICHAAGLAGRAFVITDDSVGPLYLPALDAALGEAGFGRVVVTIPSGEEHKTLATLASVLDRMLADRVERSDFVVCLGGGVVTDLGGYAAATILRGIDFVHVPTTLLGMVDAAIGGKVAVDHPRGKNMIGVFAQPRAVVIDPSVLATLPPRQIHAGWAEIIKHGLILDEQLTVALESRAGDPSALMATDLIARSVAIKVAVVSADEREGGLRTLPNYGHTLGHAIEAATGFSRYLHGEAVAIGMHAAGRIAVDIGMLSPAELDRQQALIRAYGLPETAPGLDVDSVLDATRADKKVRAGSVRWVLLDRVGNAVIRADVPDAVVRRAAAAVLG